MAEKNDIKIPVFSVLKKGVIHKNIILNIAPQDPNSSTAPILVGRHPDCHIMLDHPSISRFHLDIRADLELQRLTVTDHSSVHGTWVSGNKIEPDVPVGLVEGDKLRLGASTREYRLHWVPMSRVGKMDQPLSTLVEEDEEIHQQENRDENWVPLIPSAPPMLETKDPMVSDEPFSFPLERYNRISEMEELGENNRNICSLIPLHHSPHASCPTMEEKIAMENTYVVSEAPAETYYPSPLRSLKKTNSSSLLSRRSKSIDPLGVRTGDDGTQIQESNDTETICRVLFDDTTGREEDAFDSLKENVDLKSPSLTVSEESRSICSIALPTMEEIKETDNTERDQQSQLRLVKKVNSSSLLSRRRKSIGPLGFRTGDDGTQIQESNDTETICRVLFDDTKGREEDAFDSLKENVELKSPSLTVSEESRSICSGALPTMEEIKVTDNTERDQQSPLRSVKKVNSSSLLSRRRKSIGFLHVPAGDAEGSTSTLFRDLFDNMEGKEEEAFDSFKENAELQSSSLIATISSTEQLVLHSYQENEIPGVLELNQETPTPIDRAKYEMEEPFASSYKENLTPITSSSRKQKKSIFELQRSSPLDSSSKKLKEEYAFTPNKENRTPKVSGAMRSTKSLSKSYDRIEIEMIRKRVERIPFQCLLENSPSGFADSLDDASDSLIDRVENICVQSTRENGTNSPTLKDSGTKGSKKPLSNSRDRAEREMMKNGAERVPFQSLMDNSSLRNNSFTDHAGKASSNLANNSFSKQQEKKRWNIVVDASCLLNDDSRRSLELLEGIQGTHLIIPRIVIRELDCMKRREGLFSRSTKASSVLKWIETCMVRSSWWIHVQSSFEMMPVAPTPPASPSLQLIHASSSKAFSTCGSLLEIVSPTAEDHILDCALLFKKLKNDVQFVLLTNSITLKIKAMAEGLLCEEPTEFRESLVSPYSKRFLWMNSSPRGSTWTSSDEGMIMDEKFCSQLPVARKIAMADEGPKGLKLILPRNKTNLVM